MISSEYGRVMQLREMVGLTPGRISAESAKRGARVGKGVLGDALLNHTVDSERNLVISVLEEERDELIDDLYLEPTPAGIAAKYLIERATNIAYTVALDDLGKKDIPNFTLYYDLGYGIVTVGTKIALADRVRAIGMKQLLAKGDYNPVLTYAVREDVTFTKRLFDQDEGKGFALADAIVDVLKGNIPTRVTPLGPAHIPEFVIAGAELGVQLYKKIQPLAAQLGK
jgi:hypothetical protein